MKSSKISGDTPSMVFCQISGMLVDRKPHIAAQLLGYSEIFWQEANFPRDPTFDQPYFDRFYAAARAKLGEAEFASAWEAGLKMTVDEAIKLALKTVEKM